MSEKVTSQDFYFAHKPPGIATHRPSEVHQGFVEWLEVKTKQELKICHRLDKETSGSLVFAKNKLAAQKLTELFERRQLKKHYCFISHKKSEFEKWSVVEEETKGTRILGHPWSEEGRQKEDTRTDFEFIQSIGSYYLYKAYPRTGKTHQIRKHATHSQIAILGDDLYAGLPFCRLMLHAETIEFNLDGENFKFTAKPSRLFVDQELLTDKQLANWVVAFERREVLYVDELSRGETLRLFHTETGDLRGDLVGGILVLGWWKHEPPSDAEIAKIKNLCKLLGFKKWVFQWRPGVTSNSSAEVLITEECEIDQNWSFQENHAKYVASLTRGQNFGLFLDQRERRNWVKLNSKNKRVLNLFCFTSGFSLMAAIGGADKVVSVDLSKKYLEWSKENFLANDIDPSQQSFEFRAMDSLAYLEFANKKQLKFDILVCDPPSFSRSKKSKANFKIDRDHQKLIKLCGEVLNPGGILLFSANFEKWNFEKWKGQIATTYSELGFKKFWWSHSQWDYEWQAKQANLKAFFLQKA